MSVIIYHNPSCGTSRNTLALLHERGINPQVVEYLKTPLSRPQLEELIRKTGVPVRDILRQRGTPFDELGLENPALTDDQLIDAIMAHPILMNRPIVVTQKGAKLCRPPETVLTLI